MFLTTGIIALSRKAADEKAKKREARQGHLQVGDSEVAERAFSNGTSRSGAETQYESPDDVKANENEPTSVSPLRPGSDLREARNASRSSVESPMESGKGVAKIGSSYNENLISPSSECTRRDSIETQLPPYSPGPQLPTSPPLSSVYSRDLDGNSLATFKTGSSSTQSTNSNGRHPVRVKTVGADLNSGFPYHPELFELRVHPEKWSAFTTQVIESTKLSMNDHAKIWAAATATAMTGAIVTSIFLGRTMKRSAQERRVKRGLEALPDSSLGDTLREWNTDYFSQRGLFVHLELSESAMKNPGQQSKALRKSAHLYSNREDKERKRDERKYVIVVTQLDEQGQPTEALQELDAAENNSVELENPHEPSSSISELPGDEKLNPVELPASIPELPSSYVEMDTDNRLLLKKLQLEEKRDCGGRIDT